MNKTTVAATAIILVVIIVIGSYGVYTLSVPSETEPKEGTITIVDQTGAAVNVSTPVHRIVSIIGTEFICALGGQDKIVGRSMLTTDEEAIVPPSILDVPVVAETSFSVNLELVLELEPDLVLADEGLDDAIRTKLQDAGVAVLEEMSMAPRRETFIKNLGLILDAEEKANEYIEYEAYYENLVKERVATLTESDKPSVYFEWYKPWFSTAKGDAYHEMITTAGGINIAADEPIVTPELSPEYVTEKNPDIVVRMLTYLDGEDLAAYQTLHDELSSRSALSESNAVKEGKVYIIKNTALVARRTIGLLYLAKWFHPTLFEDIDPAAVHQEMIQKFFGTNIEGVFAYP
jgi:iron complex transport system substrate-binding protein